MLVFFSVRSFVRIHILCMPHIRCSVLEFSCGWLLAWMALPSAIEKCAKGKTAIASRSHFYVLLMMMIECESVVQMRTMFLAYVAGRRKIPHHSPVVAVFPALYRKFLHFSTLTFAMPNEQSFHWKPRFFYPLAFLLLRFSQRLSSLFVFVEKRIRARNSDPGRICVGVSFAYI